MQQSLQMNITNKDEGKADPGAKLSITLHRRMDKWSYDSGTFNFVSK
jgi:hypothetical protein